MDITAIFVHVIEEIKNENPHYCQKTTSKPTSSRKTIFNTKLNELVASITYMRDYLISNREDYVNIFNCILSMASSMTDEERDLIDKDVQDFVKLCTDVIKILRVEVKSVESKQQFEHENNAINLAEKYLALVSDFHNKQNALRLRRNLDSQSFFRLSRSIKKVEAKPASESSSNNNSDTSAQSKIESNKKSKTKELRKDYNNVDPYFLQQDEKVTENVDIYGLSPEELKIFKDEGNVIYEEMNSMNQEVNNIARKLTEISRLQEVFSENVIKQDLDLNQLNSTTVQSTEHIREGNEQLREAMRKNAGFRVWILFFITTLAFVVLFLDWYND